MEDLGLWVCIIVYSALLFWSGMWGQTKLDQRQLKQFEENSWTDGCTKCAQFEKDACARGQLQGIVDHPKITQ